MRSLTTVLALLVATAAVAFADPVEVEIAVTPPIPFGGRVFHTLVELSGGRVLVAGGRSGSGPQSIPFIYEPASGRWVRAAEMPGPSFSHVITGFAPLPDGRVLKVGAEVVADMFGGGGEGLRSYVYDPAADAWSETGSVPASARFWGNVGCRPIVLADGRVMIHGGFMGDSGLTPATFAAGGVVGSRYTFVYDPAAGTWTQAGDMHVGREEQKSVLLADGRVLTAGGHDRFTPGSHLDVSVTATAEIFDPNSHTWTDLPPMPSDPIEDAGVLPGVAGGRIHHLVQRLGDGRVLVAGGISWLEPGTSNGPVLPRRSALIFDPATDTWHPTAPMGQARSAAVALPLPDGRILVAGGYDDALLASATTEIFDPETETWSAGPMLPEVQPWWAHYVGNPAAVSVARFEPHHLDDAGRLVAGGALYWGFGADNRSATFYDRLQIISPR